ncbi:hypothetical protein HMPREF9430_01658 [Solobacterium moorei F0204]|uniref:Uncharacterized protein n=1 Tax=Solobacterium moorei F0204 TaxID=706433 RepID=E7MPT3_9FIRM|nr:hypothetical protein HMPREF9430_01658 [Solobacterium moorei F0204]
MEDFHQTSSLYDTANIYLPFVIDFYEILTLKHFKIKQFSSISLEFNDFK